MNLFFFSPWAGTEQNKYDEMESEKNNINSNDYEDVWIFLVSFIGIVEISIYDSLLFYTH